MRYKTALLRLAIVLGPSYVAAYLTGEMVWVVPTLVGGGLLASAVGSSERTATRVDEDNGGDQEDDADGEETPTGTGDE